MQTRFNFSILLAFAAIVMFSSCNKSNKIGRYIPRNASFVMHMNGESLNSKLPWDEIKGNKLFQEIYADTAMDAMIKTALDNPENTGIDIKNDLMIFIQNDSIGNYIAMQGMIKDAEKFKSFYTNVTKGSVVAGKDGMNSLSNDKMMITWNKDRYVVVFDAPAMNHGAIKNLPMPGMDSLMQQPVVPAVKRDLSVLSAMLFNLDEKISLGKDEKFSELVKKNGDIHFWINVGEIGSKTAGMAALSMLNLSKMYEGSLLTGTATFLEGKIDVDMKSYAGKEMTELFKKYEGSDISSEMIKRIPSKNIGMLLAMNFKPEGLREFLKLAGMEGLANMGAGYLGFSLDDFIKANKGDVLFSVSDITKDPSGKTNADFLFSASINDKPAFGKLIEAGKKLGQSKFGDSIPPSVHYNSTDKYFAIGNKQSTIDTYIKTESNNSFDFLDKISGSPIGVYLNFQYIMRAMQPTGADSLDMAMYNSSLQMWDNLIVKGGEFKNGGILQHLEVNLVDKKTNSLKQLNNYLGTLGTIMKNKKSKREINWGDSTVVISADTTVNAGPAN